MSCLSSAFGDGEPTLKNEFAVQFRFYVSQEEAAARCLGLEKAVAALREQNLPAFSDWTLGVQTARRRIDSALTVGRGFVLQDVILTHRHDALITAAEAEKVARKLYDVFCSKPVRSAIWTLEDIFEWTVGLANKDTAVKQDVWWYAPRDFSAYRQASALDDLEVYLSENGSSGSFDSYRTVMESIGGTNAREGLDKSMRIANNAIEAISTSMGHPQNSFETQRCIESLCRADQEMYAFLKSMLDKSIRDAQSSSEVSKKISGQSGVDEKMTTDTASVDTLLDSDAESLNEKKAAQPETPKKQPGFLAGLCVRLLASHQSRRKAERMKAASKKLALAGKKMDEMYTALERLEGHYIYSVNMHAHVMSRESALVQVVQSATAEAGWATVYWRLRVLHGEESARHHDGKLSGLVGGDQTGLHDARISRVKRLDDRQQKYSKMSAEIRGLLDEVAKLHGTALDLVGSS